MRPGEIFRRDGEACAVPCAEVLLSDRAAEIILDSGLMPLLSLPDRDVVRVGRFQSIADPSAPWRGDGILESDRDRRPVWLMDMGSRIR